MPVFNGNIGNAQETIIDTPYLKPTQTFIIEIRNYQGNTGSTSRRASEVAFYGNAKANCSDADKLCNPNLKILGLKLFWNYSTLIYLVLREYIAGATSDQNILLESISIPTGTNITFTIQIGGGKIIVKRGDKVLITTSYSVEDPIINRITYRGAQTDNENWANATALSTLANELWNVTYGTSQMFDFGKIIQQMLPLAIIGGIIPAIIGIRKGK